MWQISVNINFYCDTDRLEYHDRIWNLEFFCAFVVSMVNYIPNTPEEFKRVILAPNLFSSLSLVILGCYGIYRVVYQPNNEQSLLVYSIGMTILWSMRIIR